MTLPAQSPRLGRRATERLSVRVFFVVGGERMRSAALTRAGLPRGAGAFQ